MKKIILSVVGVLYAAFATSQPYAYLPFINKTSVWTEKRHGCSNVYVKYFYGKDTSINDTVWTELKKTYLSYNDSYSCSNDGTYLNSYVTEDIVSRKVWKKENGATILFRDYSGKVGETIFGTDNYGNWGPEFKETITIDTIVEMNGLKMRKLNDSYYEGLGYLGTFARHYILLECVDCESVNMLCYERDGKIIYQNPAFASCWPEAVSARMTDKEEKQFVPNPLRQTALIATEGYAELRIFTGAGREVLRASLDGAELYTIDPMMFAPGMYHIVLYRTDGSADTQTVQIVR